MTQLLDQTDPTEVDDFFRRGEQYSLVPGSLTPPMGIDIGACDSDGEVETDLLGSGLPVRSPEQIARRARYVRYVSATMGTLVTGLILVFASQAYALRRSAVAKQDSASVSVRNGTGEPDSAQGAAESLLAAPAVHLAVSAEAHAAPSSHDTVNEAPASMPHVESESPTDRSKAAAVAPAAEAESAPKVSHGVLSTKPPNPKSVPVPSKAVANAPAAMKARVHPPTPSSTNTRAKGTVDTSFAKATGAAPVVAQKPLDYKPPTASFSD